MRTDLPDVNVLIALFAANHEHHDAAHAWLTRAEQFATTPMTEAGFVRVMMAGTPVNAPLTCAAAIESLRELRALPNAVFWPDATTWTDHRMVASHITGHKQVADTHLLNLAIAHGGRLVTFDRRIAPSLTRHALGHLAQLG